MAADLEHLPDFATVPLLVVASPLIFIVIAELHLAADLAGREFHRMDIDVSGVGAKRRAQRPEIACCYVLSRDG
jgi:hypothetical protein